jgi:class 3 adenylate cyclase
MGDAKAFREIKNHFVDIYSEVKNQNGIVIKTIGDSVMAAFSSPEDALKAAIGMQLRFHPNRKDNSIRIRASIHHGPVMAVHLHQGIDYFGATVNLAAKLQSCAEDGEIAMSDEVFQATFRTFKDEMNFPLTTKEYSKPGTDSTVSVFVIKVDRRRNEDRRKAA